MSGAALIWLVLILFALWGIGSKLDAIERALKDKPKKEPPQVVVRMGILDRKTNPNRVPRQMNNHFFPSVTEKDEK